MTEHRLKTTIKERGLKMNYLAEKTGVSQSLLSHYLSGRRKMPNDVEFKLAKELA